MSPIASPDLLNPGVEDVIADAKKHGVNANDHTMVLNMGPQHPSTHGVLRLVLEIDGETVVSLAPDIGYLHTGIEKTCEAKFYQQVVPLTDRIDYLCPMTNNLTYCLAVEKLLELEIPERAQYIRVLMNELTRIQSHLVWLGTHAMDIGALTVFLYCFRERENLLRIFESVSGQRMMSSYFRIGGVSLELPLPDHADQGVLRELRRRVLPGADAEAGRGHAPRLGPALAAARLLHDPVLRQLAEVERAGRRGLVDELAGLGGSQRPVEHQLPDQRDAHRVGQRPQPPRIAEGRWFGERIVRWALLIGRHLSIVSSR